MLPPFFFFFFSPPRLLLAARHVYASRAEYYACTLTVRHDAARASVPRVLFDFIAMTVLPGGTYHRRISLPFLCIDFFAFADFISQICQYAE